MSISDIRQEDGTLRWLRISLQRNGIYIIDLQKTVKKVDEAYNFLRSVAEAGETVLFVGTKTGARSCKRRSSQSWYVFC